MKLKELKSVVAMVTYVVIEDTDKNPLLRGYYEWFIDSALQNKEIVTMYVEHDNLHIMIK